MARVYTPKEWDGQCEAWCWAHSSGNNTNAPVRRCSRPGLYDGLEGIVLCNQHVDTLVCRNAAEALERRAQYHHDYKEKHKQRRAAA